MSLPALDVHLTADDADAALRADARRGLGHSPQAAPTAARAAMITADRIVPPPSVIARSLTSFRFAAGIQDIWRRSCQPNTTMGVTVTHPMTALVSQAQNRR